MAARVAATRRFLADSGQELHETYRSRTNESPRPQQPLLGHRLGHDRIVGNAWKVKLLKSLSRRWAKSAFTNQSRLTACVQIERPGLAARFGHLDRRTEERVELNRPIDLARPT